MVYLSLLNFSKTYSYLSEHLHWYDYLNIVIRTIIPDISTNSHVTLERIMTPGLEPVRYLAGLDYNSDSSPIRALQGADCVFSMLEVWSMNFSEYLMTCVRAIYLAKRINTAVSCCNGAH